MIEHDTEKRVYRPGTISLTDADLRSRIGYIGLTETDLGVIAAWSDVCRTGFAAGARVSFDDDANLSEF